MENDTAQVRIMACFFFFCFYFFFLSVNVVKCDEGFVHFLHVIAKSHSAFHKINEPMLHEANRRY